MQHRHSKDITAQVQTPLQPGELERVVECERIVALQVTDYLKDEQKLNEKEDLASAFGISMLSDVFIALESPLSPEARSAIEVAYLGLNDPFNYENLLKCILSLDTIPDDSPLLERVAQHLQMFWPPEDTFDNDNIGDAFRFFDQCSTNAAVTHLSPLTESHRVPSVRERIKEYIDWRIRESVPIPVDEYRAQLLQLVQLEGELSQRAREQSVLLVTELGRNLLHRGDILPIFEEALTHLCPHIRDWRRAAVVEKILVNINAGTDTTSNISAIVDRHFGELCKDVRNATNIRELLEYYSKFIPDRLEDRVVQYLAACCEQLGSNGSPSYIGKALQKLSQLTSTESLRVLGAVFSDKNFLQASGLSFELSRILRGTPFAEEEKVPSLSHSSIKPSSMLGMPRGGETRRLFTIFAR